MAATLERDGFVVLAGLLGPDWIGKLKLEERRFRGDPSGALSVQVQLVHRSAIIREFVQSGPQLPFVVQAIGPDVCFTHQQFVTKRSDEKARTDVPWHQDNGYGRLEPPRDLTVWTALDDCDESNGCLWVVPGSHRRGLLPHQPNRGLFAASVDEEGIPLRMNAGDAVAFGSLLLHRSLPNRTREQRVAMYVRYCDPHVVMVNEGNKPVLDDGFSWMVAGEA